jgi:hypothetical protein
MAARQLKSMDIDGEEFTVRELTAGEIIDLLQAFDTNSGVMFEATQMLFLEMFKPFGLQGISAITGTPVDVLKTYPVSVLRKLYEAGKSVNADFFGTVTSLTTKPE